MESLPHDLKEFLQAVKWYFTQSVNLEREKAAVSMSTSVKKGCFVSGDFFFCRYIFIIFAVRSFSLLSLRL